MKLWRLVAMTIGIVVLMLALREADARAQVACPPTIAVEAKASAPNDWGLGYSKDAAELSSATIFEGPPEELTSLKYDDERKEKDKIVQSWELPAGRRGYWNVCG
jgi:hypothetical protein